MTTTVAATCQNGVVKVLGVTVPGVNILSEGVGASTGVLYVFEGECYYVARTSPDLVTTLAQVITALTQTKAALDKAQTVLTALDTRGFLIAATAGVPGPPTSASNIAAIGTASSAIDSAKSALQTLKDSLR